MNFALEPGTCRSIVSRISRIRWCIREQVSSFLYHVGKEYEEYKRGDYAKNYSYCKQQQIGTGKISPDNFLASAQRHIMDTTRPITGIFMRIKKSYVPCTHQGIRTGGGGAAGGVFCS